MKVIKVFAALERYKNGYTNYVTCLCHSVWMFLSLSMALSQSLLSGKSSVFFLHCIPVGICCLSWKFSRNQIWENRRGWVKKTHHIKLRDVLVHSRVGENKKNSWRWGGRNEKVFPSPLQLFSQGGAGLNAALCKWQILNLQRFF